MQGVGLEAYAQAPWSFDIVPFAGCVEGSLPTRALGIIGRGAHQSRVSPRVGDHVTDPNCVLMVSTKPVLAGHYTFPHHVEGCLSEVFPGGVHRHGRVMSLGA